MAEPRKNIAKLRGLSLGPPQRPAAETEPAPDQQPTTPREPEPPARQNRPAPDTLAPAESATTTQPEPTSKATGNDTATPWADGLAPKRRTTRRRGRQDDAEKEEASREAAARRNQATTVYLPRDTRDRLDRARGRTRASNIDLILEAIHATWRDVAAELKTPSPKTDPDLDLPRPRRPRRKVTEASTLQLRLTPAEHAGITNLAHRANVSISELVTHCIDRHWPE